MGDLRQHLLLIVDVLLLFQPDDVGDFHLFQGVERARLLVLDEEDSAEGSSS